MSGAQRAARLGILRPVRRALSILLLALAPSACVLADVSLEGRQCPCVDGFVCNTSTNLCVPVEGPDEDGGTRDAGDVARDGGFDPNRDGGPPPPRDGGPPRDAGPGRDGGPRDAGQFPDCLVDIDCAAPTSICVNETCVAGCGDPGGTACAGPEVCLDGRCIEVGATCMASADCGEGPPAATCVDGACQVGCAALSGTCLGDRQCQADGFCDVAPRCTTQGDCGHPDYNCIDQRCVRRCDRPYGYPCRGNSTCDPFGRCVGAAGIGAPCTDGGDCNTDYCLSINNPMESYCTRSCAATSDCPLDFTCARVNGAKQCVRETTFGSMAMFDVPTGGACTAEVNNCQSGLCSAGDFCLERCSRKSDCAFISLDCITVELPAQQGTVFLNACASNSGFDLGATCLNNEQCASGVCNRYNMECVQPCCSGGDCDAGDICTVYDLATALPLTVCQTPGVVGMLEYGATCNDNVSCRSGLCVPVDPNDQAGPKACSTYCCNDFDCDVLPNAGRCVTLDGPIANAQTKVCVP